MRESGIRNDVFLVRASNLTLTLGGLSSCFNGSGYSVRMLSTQDGRYQRRLGDDEWAPRKSVSFMLPIGGRSDSSSSGASSSSLFGHPAGSVPRMLVGFGAPLGTVASGAVAVERELARVLALEDRPRAGAAASSSSSHRKPAAATQPKLAALVDPYAPFAVETPSWGLECAHAFGGNVAMGTDNGLVMVASASGTARRRVLDACSLAGFRPASHKVTALRVASEKVFVALQASAGDATADGFQGKLLCFDLVPEDLPEAVL